MSKAKQLREMRSEINNLKCQLSKANERITEYQKRDKSRIQDFAIKKEGRK